MSTLNVNLHKPENITEATIYANTDALVVESSGVTIFFENPQQARAWFQLGLDAVKTPKLAR